MPQPQPGQAPGPGFIVPPVPPVLGGPVPAVVPGAYPGFFPQGAPQPPVIPVADRSPVAHSPVIPEALPGWGRAMPDPSHYVGPSGPVLPGTPYAEYHPTHPSEYVHHIVEPDERVIPETPTSATRSPLPVPGRDTIFVQPTPRPESRSSTPTQESYHPPYGPGILPVPTGGIPHVIPVEHSPPPHQTIINIPPGVPPPGQIIEPGIPITVQQPGVPIQPGGVPVQPSLQGVQPGTIVIQPTPAGAVPFPVPESVYGPSRVSSRTSTRAPVVVVQSSEDGSPVHVSPSVVGVPPSVHLHDDRIPRSPTIHAFPGAPSSAGAPIILDPSGPRPYSPGGSRRRAPGDSRSPPPRGYSPRDEGRRPRRGGRRDRSYSYSPDDRSYRGRPYSPEYDRYGYPRRRSPGYGRYYDDDYPRRGGRRRRYGDNDRSPEDGRGERDEGEEDGPRDGRRLRRRRGPDDRERPEREDEEHAPEDPGRGAPQRQPSGRSVSRPDIEEHEPGDQPRAQPSDARPAREPVEGDTARAPPRAPPSPAPPLSPAPPTIIRLGGEPRPRESLRFPVMLLC